MLPVRHHVDACVKQFVHEVVEERNIAFGIREDSQDIIIADTSLLTRFFDQLVTEFVLVHHCKHTLYTTHFC